VIRIHKSNYKRTLFPLQTAATRATSHKINIEQEDIGLIDIGQENPETMIGFRGEVPYAIDSNPKGTITIEVLKLKNHNKEARRKHLHNLKALHDILNHLIRDLNNSESQRMVVRIRQKMEEAIQPQAEFSAAARCAIETLSSTFPIKPNLTLNYNHCVLLCPMSSKKPDSAKPSKKAFSRFNLKDAYQALNIKRLQLWTLDIAPIEASEDFQRLSDRFQVFDLKRSEEGRKITIDLVFVEALQAFSRLKIWKGEALESEIAHGAADYLITDNSDDIEAPLLCVAEGILNSILKTCEDNL
jgi:hypothetical protein